MPIPEVNEQTTAYLNVTFKDKDGVAAAPTSATYQIDCVTTKTSVLASTAAPGGATPEIVITESQNAIINPKNRKERKRVTLIGNYAAGEKVTSSFDYNVINLTGIA